MAASGFTPIILYNSGTTGNTPTTGNLQVGELAINYKDGKLFYNNGTAVVAFTSGGGSSNTATGNIYAQANFGGFI